MLIRKLLRDLVTNWSEHHTLVQPSKDRDYFWIGVVNEKAGRELVDLVFSTTDEKENQELYGVLGVMRPSTILDIIILNT